MSVKVDLPAQLEGYDARRRAFRCQAELETAKLRRLGSPVTQEGRNSLSQSGLVVTSPIQVGRCCQWPLKDQPRRPVAGP